MVAVASVKDARLARWATAAALEWASARALSLKRCHPVSVALVVVLSCLPQGLAHQKGLYATEAEAAQRAKQLGCAGTHRNAGRWMPCRNEADLHKHLREH
jgi:hypothetical protein